MAQRGAQWDQDQDQDQDQGQGQGQDQDQDQGQDQDQLQEHRLEEPSEEQQENLCSVETPEGRDTASETQREPEGRRLLLQQRIQDRQQEVKLLQQELEAVNRSADEAVEDSEKTFGELIRLLEDRRCEVKRQVRVQQEAEARGVREEEEELQQEIRELQRREEELEELPRSEDQQLLSESTSSFRTRPRRRFHHVAAAVSAVGDRLRDVLRDAWTDVSLAAEPKTRAEFLQASCELSLDPDTAHRTLVLTAGGRGVAAGGRSQPCPAHPDRFSSFQQVLSREGLTGRRYWELELDGEVGVAASYASISRAGGSAACRFGCNTKSWSLQRHGAGYSFLFDSVLTAVSGPRSCRVGVYLDHGAGLLSFYSVSETRGMTLLHRVHAAFSQPLHAALSLQDGAAARICCPTAPQGD